MRCCGVRGAVTVEANEARTIVTATRELLERIAAANEMDPADVASVVLSATPDLDAAYPAVAAREMGWFQTPLLCLQEMAVEGSLPRCIRVLIHWNTDRPQSQIRHIYLRGARALRPDLLEES